jgi:cobyrinic acid a,c-diamide synthase
MKSFMIAGSNSGVGKTTITIGLISALKNLGYKVQPFKVGPDFIDPGYHTIASGYTSINLDGWMLTKDYNLSNFYKYSKNKDISIIEGVMGLFDGFSTENDSGSSAEIAKWLDIPVILIINGKSIARSAAAIVYGFENFDKNIQIKGVIFNNVSGDNHYSYLMESVKHYCKAEPLGYFKPDDFTPLPSRHLGLVTVEDNSNIGNYINEYGEVVKKRLNIGKLIELSEKNLNYDLENTIIEPYKKNIKIAVAKDNAFCFYYHDNLKILENYGAELTFFSPINDDNLPEDISMIYFGGGYPELFAEKLSKNISLIKEIRDFSDNGGFIYAECGGFIYLTEGVYDLNGKFFPFAGIFKDRAIMHNRLRSLGYAEVETLDNRFWGKRGLIIRGHEFHYSYLKNNGTQLEKIYKVTMRKQSNNKLEGYIENNTLGSYIHLHFGSNSSIIEYLFENLN